MYKAYVREEVEVGILFCAVLYVKGWSALLSLVDWINQVQQFFSYTDTVAHIHVAVHALCY